MTENSTTPPEQELASVISRLRNMLAAGAQPSRQVIAALLAQGISERQIRRARERLKVVAKRHGSGVAMHTSWALPAAKPAAETRSDGVSALAPRLPASAETPHASPPPHREVMYAPARAEVPANAVRYPCESRPEMLSFVQGLPADATPLELQRAQIRGPIFMVRGGLDFENAAAMVRRLTERDRNDSWATVSCVECQATSNPAQCPCPATPRPPTEIHHCLYARKNTP